MTQEIQANARAMQLAIQQEASLAIQQGEPAPGRRAVGGPPPPKAVGGQEARPPVPFGGPAPTNANGNGPPPASDPANRPSRPPLEWREVTLTLPARLAEFVQTIRHWDWLGAHIVLGRDEVVRELVSMAKLAARIQERGPKTCAKGHLDFGEFARLKEELNQAVRTLHRKMNRIAADARVHLPKAPNGFRLAVSRVEPPPARAVNPPAVTGGDSTEEVA